MGLFRSPIGIIFGILASIAMILFVLVLITGVLAFTGGPDPCTPGGAAPIQNDPGNAAAFDLKWAQLNAQLDGGTTASATFTESEVTSRANQFIDEKGGDIGDVQVCIYSGSGAMTGSVDLPVADAKFKVTGTVNLTGEHPVAHFDDVEVGNVPGVVLDPFQSTVEDAIQQLLDDVTLEHNFTVELQPGQAVITGTP
jgi:hypothetical protein